MIAEFKEVIPIAASLAALCVFLWLTEKVPVWTPTLILWIGIPLLLGDTSEAFHFRHVLRSAADPVLLLFLTGFTFGAAAHKQGADTVLASSILKLANGDSSRLVALAATATAFLSMWISNIAAAALMFSAFKPVWEKEPEGSKLRRAIVLSIALAANVAGVATPVATGPNGIAMAEVSKSYPLNFARWMVFGVPLALGLLMVILLLVILRLRPVKQITTGDNRPASEQGRVLQLWIILVIVIGLWLTEPLHGVPSWAVALGAIFTLLATRLAGIKDMLKLDWATLVLIAGGITLGELLSKSGVVNELATRLPLSEFSPSVRLFILCLTSAIFSALMSNTATAGFLIPLAASVDPAPSTSIIVAIAASLGMPFVISTPANSMAAGNGLLSKDLFIPGMILMLGGSLLVALTGPTVLKLVGIP